MDNVVVINGQTGKNDIIYDNVIFANYNNNRVIIFTNSYVSELKYKIKCSLNEHVNIEINLPKIKNNQWSYISENNYIISDRSNEYFNGKAINPILNMDSSIFDILYNKDFIIESYVDDNINMTERYNMILSADINNKQININSKDDSHLWDGTGDGIIFNNAGSRYAIVVTNSNYGDDASVQFLGYKISSGELYKSEVITGINVGDWLYISRSPNGKFTITKRTKHSNNFIGGANYSIKTGHNTDLAEIIDNVVHRRHNDGILIVIWNKTKYEYKCNVKVGRKSQLNIGMGYCHITPIEQENANTVIGDSLSFFSVCISEGSMIKTIKGDMKIEDIIRGTKVYCEGRYIPVSQVTRINYIDSKLVIIRKDEFDINVPQNDIICNEHHIFWLPYIINNDETFIGYRRVTAKRLISEGKASYYNGKIKRLYNLQFDEETSYFVNGVRCDAISPYYVQIPLHKIMYIDKSKYKDIKTYDKQVREMLNEIPPLEL